jgi:hypothetical protein
MIRKVGFSLVFVTAIIVAACGRQVTPNPPGTGPGGLLPGFTSIKFDVAAPFNFSSYQYFVVFNTTGNGQTPLTNPQTNNWANYSFAIEVGGNGGSTFAGPIEFLRTPGFTGQPALIHLGATPQQFQYIANSNGTGTEFTIIFQRIIFSGLNSPTPSPAPSTSPTPTPSVGPSGSPTPNPVKINWLFNAFTTQSNANGQIQFVDSMGTFGPTDTTFVSPNLAMNTCFDQVVQAQSLALQIDPPAQIESVEIANNPGNCSGTTDDASDAKTTATLVRVPKH